MIHWLTPNMTKISHVYDKKRGTKPTFTLCGMRLLQVNNHLMREGETQCPECKRKTEENA